MRLYKCTGKFSGGYHGKTEITLDLEKIDSICSSTEYPHFNYVYQNGNRYVMISDEDREKIEKILEPKFVSNE